MRKSTIFFLTGRGGVHGVFLYRYNTNGLFGVKTAKKACHLKRVYFESISASMEKDREEAT